MPVAVRQHFATGNPSVLYATPSDQHRFIIRSSPIKPSKRGDNRNRNPSNIKINRAAFSGMGNLQNDGGLIILTGQIGDSTMRKYLLALTAMTVFAVAANAATFTETKGAVLTQGNQPVDNVGVDTSATTPGTVSFKANENIQISVKCGNATSPTLKYYLEDGVTQTSQKTVDCQATPAVVDTLTAGTFPQASVLVSQSGLTGVNTQTTTVSRRPK